jgi:hypothetical protein
LWAILRKQKSKKINGLTLEVFAWLQELEEEVCCKIISESEIENFYSDTYFEISGDDAWDAYNIQVKVAGRYYKKLNTDYKEEINKIAKKDRVIVSNISWTLKLSHQQISGLTDKPETEIVKRLNSQLDSLNIQTKTEINNGVQQYQQTNYLSAIKILYPVIEQICNEILSVKGENPHDRRVYSGLENKLNKLEQLGCIDNELNQAIVVNKPRNSVLHGSFNPRLNKLVHPMCVSTMLFLTELISAKQTV